MFCYYVAFSYTSGMIWFLMFSTSLEIPKAKNIIKINVETEEETYQVCKLTYLILEIEKVKKNYNQC